MSKIQKLIAKILEGRSDANLDFNDLCHVLERTGFTRRAGKGSRTIYYRLGIEEIVNIQPHGSKALPSQTSPRTHSEV